MAYLLDADSFIAMMTKLMTPFETLSRERLARARQGIGMNLRQPRDRSWVSPASHDCTG